MWKKVGSNIKREKQMKGYEYFRKALYTEKWFFIVVNEDYWSMFYKKILFHLFYLMSFVIFSCFVIICEGH